MVAAAPTGKAGAPSVGEFHSHLVGGRRMTVLKYFALPIAAGLLIAAELGAQNLTGTLSGRVVDSTTQQPLAGATVRIEGTQRGTLTADNGMFTFGGVAAGTHQLRVSRIGYAPL